MNTKIQNQNQDLKRQCGRDVDCGRVAEISLLSFLFPQKHHQQIKQAKGKTFFLLRTQHTSKQNIAMGPFEIFPIEFDHLEYPDHPQLVGFVVVEMPHERTG